MAAPFRPRSPATPARPAGPSRTGHGAGRPRAWGGWSAAIAALHELLWIALERASSGWTPQDALLDLAREIEVLVGDATGAVCLELHADPRPRHAQVRVMIGRLCDECDGIHQHERDRPPVSLVVAANPS